jgi:hypothetical protein
LCPKYSSVFPHACTVGGVRYACVWVWVRGGVEKGSILCLACWQAHTPQPYHMCTDRVR